MASNGTPQALMYGFRQASNNAYRDRSAEQQNSTSGNPNMPMFNNGYNPNDLYNQYFYGSQNTPTGGQRSELNRYVPPMMNGGGMPGWQQSGPYSYNVPNSFGPYLGAYGSGQPAGIQAGYMAGGNPYGMPQFANGNYGMYGQGASSPFAMQGNSYTGGQSGYGMGGQHSGGFGNQIQQMMQYLSQYQNQMGQGAGGYGQQAQNMSQQYGQPGYNPGLNAPLPQFQQQGNPSIQSSNNTKPQGGPVSYGGVQSSYPSNPGGFQSPSMNGSNYSDPMLMWNLHKALGVGY